MSFVNKDKVVLNEENIDYRWCKLDDFVEKTRWFGSKKELKNVLIDALEEKVFFINEKIEEYR